MSEPVESWEPTRNALWSDIVADVDPSHAEAHTRTEAYRFGGVVFYQKKDPYNESEDMVGTEGSTSGKDGWVFKS